MIEEVNMMVYGPPGSGKTYLAKTAADAGLKVLLLDADRGRMTVRNSDVTVREVRSWADAREALKEAGSCLGEYDVVFIDHLTEIQGYRIEAAREILNEKTGKLIGKKPRPTLEDWGFVIRDTTGYVRAWRDLPVSVVVVALSMETESEGEVLIRPSLNGKKLPHLIAGLFDVVGYSQSGEGGDGYTVRFSGPGDRYCCKDRSGNLAAVEAADYAAIHNKVFQREDG